MFCFFLTGSGNRLINSVVVLPLSVSEGISVSGSAESKKLVLCVFKFACFTQMSESVEAPMCTLKGDVFIYLWGHLKYSFIFKEHKKKNSLKGDPFILHSK